MLNVKIRRKLASIRIFILRMQHLRSKFMSKTERFTNNRLV